MPTFTYWLSILRINRSIYLSINEKDKNRMAQSTLILIVIIVARRRVICNRTGNRWHWAMFTWIHHQIETIYPKAYHYYFYINNRQRDVRLVARLLGRLGSSISEICVTGTWERVDVYIRFKHRCVAMPMCLNKSLRPKGRLPCPIIHTQYHATRITQYYLLVRYERRTRAGEWLNVSIGKSNAKTHDGRLTDNGRQ